MTDYSVQVVEEESQQHVYVAEEQITVSTAGARGPQGAPGDPGPVATQIKSATIELPTGSENITLFYTDSDVTISQLSAVVSGVTPSLTWTIRHDADRSAAGTEVVTGGTTTTTTSTAQEVTTFDDATIPANSWVWFQSTAKSGTVDSVNVSIEYAED